MGKKRIIIIGGGPAGLRLAYLLSTDRGREMTLLNRREYFELPPAAPRGLIEPKRMEMARRPFASIAQTAFTQGEATFRGGRASPSPTGGAWNSTRLSSRRVHATQTWR